MIVVEEIWSAYCDAVDCYMSAELDADDEQSQQEIVAALEDLSWTVVPNQDGRLPFVFCPDHAPSAHEVEVKELRARVQELLELRALRRRRHRGLRPYGFRLPEKGSVTAASEGSATAPAGFRLLVNGVPSADGLVKAGDVLTLERETEEP